MKNSIYKYEILLGLHVLIAVALIYVPRFGTFYSVAILLYGLYRVNLHKNKDDVAMLVAAYFVGSEVLLRIFSGSLSYEFGKYGTILFLILGLMMSPNRRKPKIFVVFILLLLPSLLVIDYESFDMARQMVAFNLSGPISLAVAALYFYNKKISVTQLRKLFLCILYPIVTMMIAIYFKTGSLEDAEFTTESNFQTSGGFGPNQVSTIFGLGVTIIAVAYFMNIKLFRVKYIDVILMAAFFVRALATFSRGGVLAPLMAVVVCVVVMSLSDSGFQMRINRMVYALIIVFVVTFFGFNYVNDVSGGLLEMRYKGESMYNKDKDNMYSGREEILKEDLEIFENSMFLGVGPGMANQKRGEISGIETSAHIEYTRLMAEHGFFGIFAILIVLIVPLVHYFKLSSTDSKILLIMCVVFTCVTMGHSAMRTAAPGFMYGVAFLQLIRRPRV
jgi:hypothetical protein